MAQPKPNPNPEISSLQGVLLYPVETFDAKKLNN